MMKKKINEKNGSTKFKKIISIIEYLFIICVILVNVILIAKSVINPKKSPDLFGKKAFIIISGSMIPTINIGDIVILNNETIPNVQDIIGFKDKSSTVIVHRVIDEKEVDNEKMYQTKGDNNNVADLDLVKSENIEGIYLFKIPFVGKILMFLYNNLAIVVVILALILIIKFFLWAF